MRLDAYTPCMLECLQVHKLSGNCLISQVGLVLLQQPGACFGIFCLSNHIFDVCLLESVEGDDDAIDLSQRFV